jgi:hypothetical protein
VRLRCRLQDDGSASSVHSEWDDYDPDFLQTSSTIPVELDGASLWTPLSPSHHQVLDLARSAGYSQFDLDRLCHSLHLLAAAGIRLDHRPKIEMYAQTISRDGILLCANDQFCDLMRGSRSNILGKRLEDFVPSAVQSWLSLMLSSSSSSSVLCETLLCRTDKTLFRAFVSLHVFTDLSGIPSQTLFSIQLGTVAEVPLPLTTETLL